MVKVHKIEIEDFDDTDYGLIALTSSIEDYSLTFSINQEFKISLRRQQVDHAPVSGLPDSGFSVYEYKDTKNNLLWSLVQNQRWIQVSEVKPSLFEEIPNKIYLFPEFKHIDYFLKIEGFESEEEKLHEIVAKIKQIDKVAAAFLIDTETVKSKFNLKF